MYIPSFTSSFSQAGQVQIYLLLLLAILAGLLGLVNVVKKHPCAEVLSRRLLGVIVFIFVIGFVWICWFHYQIYQEMPLQLSSHLAGWINKQLASMNAQAVYKFALYDPLNPPRYIIPMWIENEKYYFWFMIYSIMANLSWNRINNHRLRGTVLVFLAIQVVILVLLVNPYEQPLKQFFAEVGPWFSGSLSPMQQFGQFLKLYPKMIFYYNASYMWLHPPMLFLSYGAITITFLTSIFMLIKREVAIETLGYNYAKFGYFMLTLGMLLGYPWALKAWGPNWWWDPKICSSIMMWAIYSTYLHTRLYANKKWMWYFTAILGILCFVAMLFTFITSFYFPGEHTFQ